MYKSQLGCFQVPPITTVKRHRIFFTSEFLWFISSVSNVLDVSLSVISAGNVTVCFQVRDERDL